MARGAVRSAGLMSGTPLATFPIHLGRGGAATAQPLFDGMVWYEDYAARAAADGRDGWLVSLYRFDEDRGNWEMHPVGHEVVLCVEGAMTLHQQLADGREESVRLAAGDYAINPPGAWHSADVAQCATVLFITAGEGTEQRAR